MPRPPEVSSIRPPLRIHGSNRSYASQQTATDTDTLTPQADLQITKTDGKTTVVPGTADTYTIVVTNAGPGAVSGATIADTFPATFTNATYTAVGAGRRHGIRHQRIGQPESVRRESASR